MCQDPCLSLTCSTVCMQDAGILVSRKVHGAHHKAPFEGNYCIVSGFWNPILDAGGADTSFFRGLERFVLARTGTKCQPDIWMRAHHKPGIHNVQGRQLRS